ncbi:hypothetical protein ABI59_11065 [Acidobacteria bacterium Mor1]|nr:hypothetical protein ABI59_11065 [Acidobacteria bacterium Mor1]
MSDSQLKAPLSLTLTDPTWPQEFQQMKSCLLDAAEGRILGIEHIGSTALVDVPARPVIDLLAGVEDARQFDELEPYIIGLNYRRQSVDGLDPRVRQYARPRAGEATHVVHLAEQGTPYWNQAIAFRDLLKASPLDTFRYASFKGHLVEVFAQDPEAYLEGKLTFMRSLINRADS